MDAVLYLVPVSGLAVACMETVLEHGSHDIVAFMLFFKREPFDLLSESVDYNDLALEIVPPSLIVLGNSLLSQHRVKCDYKVRLR